MTLHANSELAIVGWLKQVSDLNNAVATELPVPDSSWETTGFVRVRSIGGTPDIYTGIRKPVASIDCWACALNSAKPPWNKANQLAEIIRVATLDHTATQRVVVTPTDYNNAVVMTAFMVNEPQRVYGDEANYARYVFDLELWWKEVPK